MYVKSTERDIDMWVVVASFHLRVGVYVDHNLLMSGHEEILDQSWLST
jgi:hypothetical protein